MKHAVASAVSFIVTVLSFVATVATGADDPAVRVVGAVALSAFSFVVGLNFKGFVTRIDEAVDERIARIVEERVAKRLEECAMSPEEVEEVCR